MEIKDVKLEIGYILEDMEIWGMEERKGKLDMKII